MPRWCSLLALALVAQQVAPLDRPEVGVLVAGAGSVDPPRRACSATCRPGTSRTSSGVGSVPMASRIGAAQERGVVGQRAGRRASACATSPAPARRCSSSAADVGRASAGAVGERDADAADVDLAHVAGHDRGLAGARRRCGPGRRSSTLAMSGSLLLNWASRVTSRLRAVGVVRRDEHLLLARAGRRPRASGSTRCGRPRDRLAEPGGVPLLDPAAQQVVLGRVGARSAGRRRAAPRRSPSAAAGCCSGAAGKTRRPRASLTRAS